MDGAVAVILISVAMFVGCFLLGLIPLIVKFSQQKQQFITVLGAGLLCGTALAIIIPEGVELLEGSSRDSLCSVVTARLNTSDAISTLKPSTEKGLRPHVFIGASLVLGFTLMFVVDQIADYCSAHADGMALGAAVASSQVSVQVIVFFAVILHKAPAAFGLVSFLMHAGLESSTIRKHLLAFSCAAPLTAISTYFILIATGGSSEHRLSATGIGMLVSAGTFLYVATVHVLPEINSRGQQRSGHIHQHAGTGQYHHAGLGLMESITLVIGAGLPVLLALGLPDE
ncbi:zinc transporter ZIP9 isoform X2 [Neoarius graeffei]|uniref:zinc transporter ZIP9 isoform X2 n=1 Tax=Neoarius graeffei TaxID=443677 RepID=UPI00298BF8F5|nr:zinc transporter ZIP9 isoform X2 [Neoarius graeffei]